MVRNFVFTWEWTLPPRIPPISPLYTIFGSTAWPVVRKCKANVPIIGCPHQNNPLPHILFLSHVPSHPSPSKDRTRIGGERLPCNYFVDQATALLRAGISSQLRPLPIHTAQYGEGIRPVLRFGRKEGKKGDNSSSQSFTDRRFASVWTVKNEIEGR